MKKNLLLTYDYELFLGLRSGRIESCLLDPTSRIFSSLARHNSKAVFFVDTVYLLRLKEKSNQTERCRLDIDRIITQIQEMVEKGHYIFPHIHPHWLDASYLQESNEWRLENISKYRIHSLSESERKNVFDESVHLLKEIIKPVSKDYKMDCYRAGGWCIQPFNDFKSLFEQHQLKYDMSVMKGFYLFSTVQFFDFSSAPAKNIYRFEEDVIVENPNGKFTEFAISSVEINGFALFMDKVLLKYLSRIKGDHAHLRGQGQIAVNSDMEIPSSKHGENFLSSRKERIAQELLTSVKLQTYLDFFKKNNYMHFISHPKMLTQHNHNMFEIFLDKVYSRFEIETDFRKMI